MHTSTTIIPQIQDDLWTQYFNPRQAVAAVAAHIRALPSSQTAEQHTRRVYEAGLKYFLDWSDGQLPTEDLITAFIAHLKARGLRASTISSKYLAPARLYLRKLAGQRIQVYGTERDFVQDCKEHIRMAAAVRPPRPETTSNLAPLWRPEFKRLTLPQVRSVLRQIDRTTIAGLRDYALLYIAFSTGLRLAELQRITLASISQQGDHHILTVRGKRSNIDPVPISTGVLAAIEVYVQAYNAPLADDDPRRITDDSPLWQPLLHGDHHAHPGSNGYDPARGISQQSLRCIISRRTADTLGPSLAIAAHDTRRTAAALAYDAGMPLTDIQALLRHKDAAVTLRYVGTKPDFASRALETYVQIV